MTYMCILYISGTLNEFLIEFTVYISLLVSSIWYVCCYTIYYNSVFVLFNSGFLMLTS